MQQFNLETRVGADGMLHLDLPVPVKNADLKITLTWQTLKKTADNPVKQRLKAKFASVPKNLSLADELIAERREEAKRELSV
jgi:hypothetical protein